MLLKELLEGGNYKGFLSDRQIADAIEQMLDNRHVPEVQEILDTEFARPLQNKLYNGIMNGRDIIDKVVRENDLYRKVADRYHEYLKSQEI